VFARLSKDQAQRLAREIARVRGLLLIEKGIDPSSLSARLATHTEKIGRTGGAMSKKAKRKTKVYKGTTRSTGPLDLHFGEKLRLYA
jgi:hypothetical protein